MDSSVSVKENSTAAAPREPTAAQSTATGGQPGQLMERSTPTQKAGKTTKPIAQPQRTALKSKAKPVKAKAGKTAKPAGNQLASSEVNTRLSKLEDLLESVIQRLPAQTNTKNSTGVPPATATHTPAPARREPQTQGQPRAAHSAASMHTQPYSGEQAQAEGEDMDTDMGLTHAVGNDEEDYTMVLPDEVPLFAAKFAVNNDIGDPVAEEVAQSATYLLTHQLENKSLEDTAAKYAVPSNCQAIDTPRVNPFIWDNLPTHTKSRDLKLQKIQKSLTKGINAFTRSLSADNISDSQQDALALLCNSSFELNCLRRELIKPDLDAKCARLCKPENVVGTTNKLLFGDNLSKKVKDLMEEQKVTAGVMKGQRKSYSSPHTYRGYKPSPGFTSATQRSYKEAGWSRSRAPATATRPISGSGERPFLGRNPRQYRQPQGNKKPPAPQTQWKR